MFNEEVLRKGMRVTFSKYQRDRSTMKRRKPDSLAGVKIRVYTSNSQVGRGRDTSCLVPPARIRTSARLVATTICPAQGPCRTMKS
jgi:hypothetical protein